MVRACYLGDLQALNDFIVLLMLALCVLSAFNLLVLLYPPPALSDVLTLMDLPWDARWTILVTVIVNIFACLGFERWGAQWIAAAISRFSHWRSRGRRRVREGKMYKAVEGGMR
jgi:cation-transporting P-type ATPase 13A2